MTRAGSEDQRILRTRAALTQAFMDLVAEQDYEAITVAGVIERAGVGRSTFYQHYAGKEDLTAAVMEGGFLALAHIPDNGPNLVHLEAWLEIFWNNRRAGRVLLSGPTRAYISRELAARLEPGLRAVARYGSRPPPLAMPLIAVMAAEAQLGLLLAWLNGQTHARPSEIAEALVEGTRGLAYRLFGRA